MANLSLQNFTTLVANMTSYAQGAATSALDFTVGSTLRAITEASASVALWLQYLILQVLAITRLATSTGSDVDTFVGDFGLSRLAGTASTVPLALSTFSPLIQSAVIPPGTPVGRTSDATLTYDAYEDTTNPAWNAAAGGYIRPAGMTSITVPCICETVGSVGNVQPGTINLLASQIAGVDTVNNGISATGGLDAETDTALKTRFAAYINSRSGATLLAVEAAIEGVQQGLDFSVLEDQAPDGSTRYGFFTVLLDDGSGHPPATLLASVYAAVNAIRPIGISFAVVAPGVVTANVAAAITVAAGSSNGQAQNAAATAITDYLTGLGIGAQASYAQMSANILLAGTGIASVTSLSVNGGTANVVPTSQQVVRPGTITVTATGGTSP